ncbi:nuclear transport factor 2 family protein [Bdellovibrio bacteriovorus]|uniref:nuclear transport factor 2 family protein n=1 Tax=Bdellovibrio bacteriovorus TaxID=959 RepID=UPI0035A93D03
MTSFQNSSSNEDIEVIKQVYSGINRNDVDFVLNLMDANVFRIEFESGTYRGYAEMRSHLISGRSTWAEGACEPVEFFPKGNKIVVIVHVKVRLKNNSQWIDAHTTDGFELKEGRVTEFHSFTTKQKAIEWAQIKDSQS